jgi:membrane-bound inhibitor of C-type lysozyme
MAHTSPLTGNPTLSIAAFIALLAAAGMLASNAYTRETAEVITNACPGGDRFSVEFQQTHVRLRTGAGIFALPRQSSDSPNSYSDGRTIFSTHGDTSVLVRPGIDTERDCRPVSRKS